MLHTGKRKRKRGPAPFKPTLNSEEAQKIKLVQTALAEGDVERLKKLARGGLVNETLRCKAWPSLLGLSNNPKELENYESLIVEHPYTDQVAKDVDRSLWKLVRDEIERGKVRKQLSNIMNAVLSQYPSLHYFQGFHDIASVLLLVCGHKQAFAMLRRLSLYHLRDHMNENMKATMEVMYQLMPLIDLMDKEVHDLIAKSGSPPFFCLSWVLTWFSHSIDDLPTITRLFDFFLSSSPYASLYMSAVIIVYRREGLKAIPSDASHVHKFISDLPKDLPWEYIIEQTSVCLSLYPPSHPRINLPPPDSQMKPLPWTEFNDIYEEKSIEERTAETAEYEKDWKRLMEVVVVGVVSVAVIALTHAH